MFQVLRQRVKAVIAPGDAARFWLAQGFLVASTIIGVYLAASVGFDKAIQFEVLREERALYYLLASLRDELEDNSERIVAVAREAGRRGDLSRVAMEGRLQTFVWDAMRESAQTFQVPARVLTGTRRFHARIRLLVEDLARTRISRALFLRRVQEEVGLVRGQVLPAVDAELERLRRRLGPLVAVSP